MTLHQHKRRLKGLEEMPIPRHSLRQRLYRLRTLTLRLKYFGLGRLLIWITIAAGIAHMAGYPVTIWFYRWIATRLQDI
jgi:hypothetical protein